MLGGHAITSIIKFEMLGGYRTMEVVHGTWSMMGHERGGKLMELDQNLENMTTNTNVI